MHAPAARVKVSGRAKYVLKRAGEGKRGGVVHCMLARGGGINKKWKRAKREEGDLTMKIAPRKGEARERERGMIGLPDDSTPFCIRVYNTRMILGTFFFVSAVLCTTGRATLIYRDRLCVCVCILCAETRRFCWFDGGTRVTRRGCVLDEDIVMGWNRNVFTRDTTVLYLAHLYVKFLLSSKIICLHNNSDSK